MGKLYLVGIGPGGAEEVTPRARRALEGAQQLFAYAGYWELARAFLPGRTCITTPMTGKSTAAAWRCRRPGGADGRPVVRGGTPGSTAWPGR